MTEFLICLIQQTSPEFFIGVLGVVGIFIFIIAIVGISEQRKEETEKNKWIEDNKDRLKIQELFFEKFLNPLINQVPNCKKCGESYYQVWDINSVELKIRCVDCKKIEKIELLNESANALVSLNNYISFVQEAYSNPNEGLRNYLINHIRFDFGALRTNQPLIRAILFNTLSNESSDSQKINIIFTKYKNLNEFDGDEYFNEYNICFNQIGNILNGDNLEHITKSFKENKDVNKIIIQVPARVLKGTQAVINVFRENVPSDIIDHTSELITNVDSVKEEKNSRRISQRVKDKVWNRDGGKCVECGSNQLLEFDHIIPHSKGGSNTYRNIQLLCEPCNRSKSAKIG